MRHAQIYPPADIAFTLARASHALPHSPPAARARLAIVTARGVVAGWSDATRAAHAMREVAWLAIARHLGEPISRLQAGDPAALLERLRRAPPEAGGPARGA